MDISRRRFLRTASIAGAALVGGNPASPCFGFGNPRLFRTPPDGAGIKGLDNRRFSILYYASLAPSGHNTQPWTVRIRHNNEWLVGIDERRHLSATDLDSRIALLSLGAFVENLCLAAGALGLQAEPVMIDNDNKTGDIFKIHLSETKSSGFPLKRIAVRMTAKMGYRQKEISMSDVAFLSKLAGGNLFYFPRGSSHATCIEEGAIEHFKEQVGRDNVQQELVRWLRLKEEDVKKFRDGLTVEGMEIQCIKGWFVKHFIEPEDFLKISFRKQSIDHTARLAGQGGGWFVITSDGHSASHIAAAGRKFERMALGARERGIALHPMTQYLEESQGRKEISENHAPEIIPQFVIRVGYLDKYPDPVSPRRPVGWFLKT